MANQLVAYAVLICLAIAILYVITGLIALIFTPGFWHHILGMFRGVWYAALGLFVVIVLIWIFSAIEPAFGVSFLGPLDLGQVWNLLDDFTRQGPDSLRI